MNEDYERAYVTGTEWLVCKRCGNMVRSDMTETHDKWHLSHEMAKTTVASPTRVRGNW